jgi:hypothetical protein
MMDDLSQCWMRRDGHAEVGFIQLLEWSIALKLGETLGAEASEKAGSSVVSSRQIIEKAVPKEYVDWLIHEWEGLAP